MCDDEAVLEAEFQGNEALVSAVEAAVRQTKILNVVFIATALILAVSLGFSIWTATCQP